MKICILTQPLHTNYGGLLQAYALQVVLRRLGHEVWTEDRRAGRYSALRRLVRSDLFRVVLGRQRYLTDEESRQIKKYTDRFIAQNINTTVVVDSTDKQMLEQYHFDAYIVGSDQVWRKEYSPGIENYFLDFVPDSALKIAYAASFGVSQWEYNRRQTHRLSRLAQRFDLLTVREADGVAMCREWLGVDAKQVLDPTLLLAKEEYQKLIDQECDYKFGEEGGLVSYILDPTSQKSLFVAAVVSELGVGHNDVSHTHHSNLYDGRDIAAMVVPPVAAWLSGFNDAQYVVTDSFHGVVLSIIFNCQFVVLSNAERGVSRFTSLLSLFGLEDRLVVDLEKFDSSLLTRPIDYTKVNALRKQLQHESLELLVGALNQSKG